MNACFLNNDGATDCGPWPSAHRTRRGFTLIELLVVMAILIVLAVLLVPQIRLISKDRTLRETARAVSASLAEAVERARVEGSAGIALVRNPRFYRYVDNVATAADPQGARVFYACYTLYQLKPRPPYIGNFEGDVAYFFDCVDPPPYDLPPNDVFEVYVPWPMDSSASIDVGSYLQLGNNPNRYLILEVEQGAASPLPGTIPVGLTRVRFRTEPHQSGQYAADGTTLAFRIFRRPRLIVHSEVNLPRGYIVNLNYSGPLQVADVDGNDFTWTEFTRNLPVLPGPVELNAEPILIFFDANGGIDYIMPNGYGGPRIIPSSPVNLCIAPDEFRHSFPLSTAPTLQRMPQSFYENPSAGDVLNDPDLMWVSLDHRTGYVGVGTSAPPLSNMAAELSGNVSAMQIQRTLEAWRMVGRRVQAAQ